MILCKSPELKAEYESKVLHPELEAILTGLAAFCEHESIPPAILTCLGRNDASNANVGGVANSLHMDRPVRAFDLRTQHWRVSEVVRVVAYFQRFYDGLPKRYEFIHVPHGNGPHIHFGLRRGQPELAPEQRLLVMGVDVPHQDAAQQDAKDNTPGTDEQS